jgi:hypothetical protein
MRRGPTDNRRRVELVRRASADERCGDCLNGHDGPTEPSDEAGNQSVDFENRRENADGRSFASPVIAATPANGPYRRKRRSEIANLSCVGDNGHDGASERATLPDGRTGR